MKCRVDCLMLNDQTVCDNHCLANSSVIAIIIEVVFCKLLTFNTLNFTLCIHKAINPIIVGTTQWPAYQSRVLLYYNCALSIIRTMSRFWVHYYSQPGLEWPTHYGAKILINSCYPLISQDLSVAGTYGYILERQQGNFE